jgi:hypothetical protein
VTNQGSADARFQRALGTGNITLIRTAAGELPSVGLADALEVCLVLRGAEPESYERAVLRWLGRFCLEQPDLRFSGLRVAMESFEQLPKEPDRAARRLRQLCR